MTLRDEVTEAEVPFWDRVFCAALGGMVNHKVNVSQNPDFGTTECAVAAAIADTALIERRRRGIDFFGETE